MSWAIKRQATYISFLILILIIIFGVPLYLSLTEPETCDDGILNQDEKDVDCGGNCPQICDFQRAEPVILWTRLSKVVDGVYNAIAYVENTNLDVSSPNSRYIFRLFDSEGILIVEREGQITIPPHKVFAVFEGGIRTLERIPKRVTFDFKEQFTWLPDESVESDISVSGERLISGTLVPKVEAHVKNLSTRNHNNIELVAILYDKESNAIAFSKTVIDSLRGGDSKTAIFTWPESFNSTVSKIEVLPRIKGR